MRKIRLIDTDLAVPAYTAALDETLLESVDGCGPPTLHLYRRTPPAVTLGYFLKVEEHVHLGFCKEKGIDVIRRMSGGGAIYTDEGQLVFGIAVKDILPEAPAKCFELVCGSIAEALSDLGCEARYSPVNDILVNGKKVSGSAIVNRAKSKLLHGTIIVDLDRDKMFGALKVPDEKLAKKGKARPEELVTSLIETIGHPVEMDQVKYAVVNGICRGLDLEPLPGPLTEDEMKKAKALVGKKYGNPQWNLKI